MGGGGRTDQAHLQAETQRWLSEGGAQGRWQRQPSPQPIAQDPVGAGPERLRPGPSACAAPQLSFQRKVGILYCRAGQGSEEEMYNNQEAGPAFTQFLTLLGDLVRLKGFESYRAQLDTKSEARGAGSGGGPVLRGRRPW